MKLTLRTVSRFSLALFAALLCASVAPNPLSAQAEAASTRAAGTDPMKIYYLKDASQASDGNDILTGLRIMLDPTAKIYLEPRQNAIIVRGTPDQLALAGQIIEALDKPGKIFRLTYTIRESDAGKRIGSQSFALIVHAGQRTTLKQGSKIPIATGQYGAPNIPEKASEVQTQFTYLDVGYNFDATLALDGQTLKSVVEQSSVAEEQSIANVQEPIIRQSVLQGTALLTLGKPLTLGSLDLPGSTRHLDVEVLLEPVK